MANETYDEPPDDFEQWPQTRRLAWAELKQRRDQEHADVLLNLMFGKEPQAVRRAALRSLPPPTLGALFGLAAKLLGEGIDTGRASRKKNVASGGGKAKALKNALYKEQVVALWEASYRARVNRRQLTIAGAAAQIAPQLRGGGRIPAVTTIQTWLRQLRADT
jgi:hypothetical protein